MSSPERSHIEQPEGREIDDISFKPWQDKTGNVVVFRSSSPDRKNIRLAAGAKPPREGQAYKVRVVEDTNPDDPMKGEYVVEIVPDPAAIAQADYWKPVAENVAGAERIERQRRRASKALRDITGKTRQQRGEAVPAPDVTPTVRQSVLSDRQRKVLAGLGLEPLETIDLRASLEARDEKAMAGAVDALLGSEHSPERQLIALQRQDLTRALRQNAALEAYHQELLDKQTEVLKDITDSPTSAQQEALELIGAQLNAIASKRHELMQSSPEAYFGLHLQELKHYRRDLEPRNGKPGRIAETPYVREQIDDIVAHFRAGKPVMLYGHLGTGKTELAMHIAREEIGKDALVVSGSKFMSEAELYGHQVLDINKIPDSAFAEVVTEVADKQAAWVKEHPEASEQERNQSHDRLLQIYQQKFSGGTISDFLLGPIYRAMEEGRPVIIDEVNSIKHEVLISLNHILTRRPGETIKVQQDSGREITIKEGYGVIMTGNLNQGQEKYVDRQEMDSAFLSRLHRVEYDYLPQSTEGSLDESAGEGNELYHLILTKLMDRNGNLEAPMGSLEQLWRLAQASRITQNVFAGREVNNAFYYQEAGGRAVPYTLKESVLSMRALDNILGQWKAEGFQKELDHYLWSEFIGQSTTPSDRAYLYQLFRDRFGFFHGGGWSEPNYDSALVSKDFKVTDPRRAAEGGHVSYGPRELVEAAFGKAPERAQWPEMTAEGAAEDVEANKDLMELEEFKRKLGQDVEELDHEVGEFCAIDQGPAAAPAPTGANPIF